MANVRNIQWFPGHMAKTERELAESVKFADLIIEVMDARIPRSSANPDFEKIFAGRRRLIVLNKSDLADPAYSKKWIRFFETQKREALLANARRGEGVSHIRAVLRNAADEKTKKMAGRGVVNRPVRAIIAGIPNSGKSSLINSLASKAATKTGDTPGVTKRRQWIRVDEGVELLDTPGVLWPKFENADVALHLAFTGAIRDETYDIAEVAEKLLAFLYVRYPADVVKRYGKITISDKCIQDGGGGSTDKERSFGSQVEPIIKEFLPGDQNEVNAGQRSINGIDPELIIYPFLENAGMARGFLMRGGVIDIERTAAIVLNEFRAAKICRVTLEEL